jgi:hypothetical protein
MAEREPGPLEKEIESLINRVVGSGAHALQLMTGEFDDAAFAGLSPEDRRRAIDDAIGRNTAAMRAAVLRLAREIDMLPKPISGRD